jgi:hypothetical protein
MADAEQPQTPDVYADQFIITIALWGASLSFLKAPPHPAPGQAPQAIAQAVVRMSLEHAKVMTLIMRRQIKKWERENVEIALPPDALNQMGLSLEDW